MLPFKKKIILITSQGVLLLMSENKLEPNSIFFFWRKTKLSFLKNITDPNVNEIGFIDIEETDLAAYW